MCTPGFGATGDCHSVAMGSSRLRLGVGFIGASLAWMVRGLCSGGGNGWGKVRSVEAPVMVWPGFFSTTKTIAEPLGLWRNGS
jgi:hypothetical protein